MKTALLALLVGAIPLAAIAQARHDTVVLTCYSRYDDGPVTPETLTIDFKASTVDGRQAQITDDSIVWVIPGEGKQIGESWYLDRHTGELSGFMGVVNTIHSVQGTCKPDDRKF